MRCTKTGECEQDEHASRFFVSDTPDSGGGWDRREERLWAGKQIRTVRGELSSWGPQGFVAAGVRDADGGGSSSHVAQVLQSSVIVVRV